MLQNLFAVGGAGNVSRYRFRIYCGGRNVKASEVYRNSSGDLYAVIPHTDGTCCIARRGVGFSIWFRLPGSETFGEYSQAIAELRRLAELNSWKADKTQLGRAVVWQL